MGYMVCYNCGGYYKLRPDETPYQYKKCGSCGGNLKYCAEIEVPDRTNEDKVGVWRKKIKPKGYEESPMEIIEEKKKLSAISSLLSGTAGSTANMEDQVKNMITMDGIIFIGVMFFFIPAIQYNHAFLLVFPPILLCSAVLVIAPLNKKYGKVFLKGAYLICCLFFGLSILISVFTLLIPILNHVPLSDYWLFIIMIFTAIMSAFLSYHALNRSAVPDYVDKYGKTSKPPVTDYEYEQFR